jgi:hypothetical protein
MCDRSCRQADTKAHSVDHAAGPGQTRGQAYDVRGFVRAEVPGARERGVEKGFVARAGRSAKLGEQHVVRGEEGTLVEPDGFAAARHLASSRRVLR